MFEMVSFRNRDTPGTSSGNPPLGTPLWGPPSGSLLNKGFIWDTACTPPPALQQTRDIEPMLVQFWINVADGVPTLGQHWFNVSCLLGETEHGMLTQRWFNAGPPSATLAQH